MNPGADPPRYDVRLQPAARRAIAQRLPESVAAAVLEFCESALAANPHRIGKPLELMSQLGLASTSPS